MFGPALTAAFTKRIIDRAWDHLSYTVQSHFSRELDAALQQEMKDERAHRRFGARFTRGQASYRLGAEYAAKLFIMRHVFEAPTSVDLSDLGGLRQAVVMSYTLAARMRKTYPQLTKPGVVYPTLADVWHEKLKETTFAVDRMWQPTKKQNGGTVRSMKACADLSHIMGRLEKDHTLSLDGPIFLTLDYAVDIAVH